MAAFSAAELLLAWFRPATGVTLLLGFAQRPESLSCFRRPRIAEF